MLTLAVPGHIRYTAVTAITLLVGAVISAVKVIMPMLAETRKNTAAVQENTRGVEKVHALVNNQLDRQLDRNDRLTRTLTAAGVDVPVPATAEAEADAERLAGPGT